MRWLLLPLLALSLDAQDAAGQPIHGLLQDAAACTACHREAGASLWEAHRWQPCTAFCMTCHAPADMAQHHSVGKPLRRPLSTPLPLAKNQVLACFTCHDLSRPREDALRWKAESLFGRLFRRQARHRTYLLVHRNDRGQLCRICH
ncbi:MAG: hypothetical protein IPI84_13645 [Holophagaceae bacterium]|nr:hypothetical protein [Holophagaceae bacterium]